MRRKLLGFFLFVGLVFSLGVVAGYFLWGKKKAHAIAEDHKMHAPSHKGHKKVPISIEQLLNVEITKAHYMYLEKTIDTYAELVHPETDITDITFKVNGYVEKLYADFTGKYVKKGEPLLTIYSPELVSAQEEFLRAYEYYLLMQNATDPLLKRTAKSLYEAAYKRLLYWDIAPKEIERLKKTREVRKTLTLYSPYDGWVMEKWVYTGSEVKVGKPVLRLAKHRRLWLMLKVYEKDIPFIRVGQKIKIYFESEPNKEYRGKIDYIYPMMDFKNRTIDVRVIILNPNYRWVPGMYAHVRIKVPVGRKLVLPETAVINTGKKQVVFLYKEEGVFHPKKVRLGRYIEGFYEILEGLKEGDVVANSSLFLLDADAQIRGLYKEEHKPDVVPLKKKKEEKGKKKMDAHHMHH